MQGELNISATGNLLTSVPEFLNGLLYIESAVAEVLNLTPFWRLS